MNESDSISHSIDKKRKLVLLKCTGEVTFNQLISYIDRMLRSHKIKPGMNTLADFTGVDRFELSYFETVHLRGRVESMQDVEEKSKWAVVTREDLHYAVIRLFSIMSQYLHLRTRVFHCFEDAERWLSGEEAPAHSFSFYKK